MTLMTTTAAFPPAGSAPLTVQDLEGLPDDGRRYELIDGVLIMSPAPRFRHQWCVGELYSLLRTHCPEDLCVLMAPFAIHPDGNTELQPDLLVARLEDFTDADLPGAPLAAVEVLSPSTAVHDLNTKKAVYERMGTPSYWVVDPQQPSVTVFELGADGSYHEAGAASGAEAVEITAPFEVRIVPEQITR